MLFCTENVSDNVKLAVDRRKSTSIVRTLEFRDTVVIRATEREDQWGDSVLARVCSTIDNILFLNLLNIWKLTLEERKDTR